MPEARLVLGYPKTLITERDVKGAGAFALFAFVGFLVAVGLCRAVLHRTSPLPEGQEVPTVWS